MAQSSKTIRRVLSVGIAGIYALAAAGCSSSSSDAGPALKPASSPPCAAPVKDGLVVSYSTGTAFNEDRKAFEAYADGHVDVHQSTDVSIEKTVTVGAAAVTALLADVEATGALSDAPGCYLYKNVQPVNADEDTGGYLLWARGKDGPYDFDVYGPAPASVDAAAQRLALFFTDVVKL